MAEETAAQPGGGTKKQVSPPGNRIKYLLAALVIILLAAGAYLYLQQSGERELSLSEFRARFNLTQRAAVVQDLRALPAEDYASRSALQNCGIQLSYALSLLGKNVTNYALLEDGSCFGGSAASLDADACLSEIRNSGRLMFTISYNSTSNRTRLFRDRVEFSGDGGFLSACAITTVIK